MHDQLKDWINLLFQIDKKGILSLRADEELRNFVEIGDKIVIIWENLPDGVSRKYYLLALFSPEGSPETLTLSEIEMEIEKSDQLFAEIGRPNASDSYLILLYPVEKITNKVYIQAMEEEEISVQFKRYALYYTQEEFDVGMKWLLEAESRTLEKSLLEELDQLKNKLTVEFLKRVLIKIPFFCLTFTARELPKFNDILMNKLSNIQNIAERTEALEIKSMLFNKGVTADDMASKLLEEINYGVEKELCTD